MIDDLLKESGVGQMLIEQGKAEGIEQGKVEGEFRIVRVALEAASAQ